MSQQNIVPAEQILKEWLFFLKLLETDERYSLVSYHLVAHILKAWDQHFRASGA